MVLLTQLAALTMGLVGGATLFIALALVPYWQSLEPFAFTQWFGDNSHFIARVMLPLALTATAMTWLACGHALWKKQPSQVWLIIASLCALLVVITYPLYFRATNEAFIQGVLSAPQITDTLLQWQQIHWLRTAFAISACLCMLLCIRRSTNSAP